MNPDDKPANNIIFHLLPFLEKHDRPRPRTSCPWDSHQKRGRAVLKKRRRQIAQASRRSQRRLAKGKRR